MLYFIRQLYKHTQHKQTQYYTHSTLSYQKTFCLSFIFTSSLNYRVPTNARMLIYTYVQLKKSQAVLTQAAERAAELLESKRMVDETGRRLKEKKEVLKE